MCVVNSDFICDTRMVTVSLFVIYFDETSMNYDVEDLVIGGNYVHLENKFSCWGRSEILLLQE